MNVPGERTELIIQVSSRPDGMYRIGYGFNMQNNFDKKALMLFNGLCDGYDRKDTVILEVCDLLLSVTESLKLQYPEISKKVRKIIIEELKKNK